jgi:hypothetical protein
VRPPQRSAPYVPEPPEGASGESAIGLSQAGYSFPHLSEFERTGCFKDPDTWTGTIFPMLTEIKSNLVYASLEA